MDVLAGRHIHGVSVNAILEARAPRAGKNSAKKSAKVLKLAEASRARKAAALKASALAAAKAAKIKASAPHRLSPATKTAAAASAPTSAASTADLYGPNSAFGQGIVALAVAGSRCGDKRAHLPFMVSSSSNLKSIGGRGVLRLARGHSALLCNLPRHSLLPASYVLALSKFSDINVSPTMVRMRRWLCPR